RKEREGAARERAVLALAERRALAASEALLLRHVRGHGALVLVPPAEAAPEVGLLPEIDELRRVEDGDRVRVVAADRDAAVLRRPLLAAVEGDDGRFEGPVKLADVAFFEQENLGTGRTTRSSLTRPASDKQGTPPFPTSPSPRPELRMETYLEETLLSI